MHPFRERGRPRFSERGYQHFLREDKPVSLNVLEDKASVHAMSFVACMLARDPNLRSTPEQALCASAVHASDFAGLVSGLGSCGDRSLC